MEEVSKENGHRPSVSMPSLDPTDDFPSHTESSEPVFVLTDSYISTASTDTIVPSGASSVSTSEGVPISSSESISTENTQSVGESSTGILTEEVSSESLIEAGPANNFVESNSSEPPTEGLIEGAQTEALTDPQSGVLQPGLDESQVEEDDSIAIDQFIKKIADEQLSSKRIEERKEEEEAQEQGENDGNLNEDENKENTASSNNEGANNESTSVLSESASENHDAAMETTSVRMEQTSIMNDSTLTDASAPDNIIPPNPEAEAVSETKPEAQSEPMEVVSETPAVPSQKFDMLEEKTTKDPPQVVEEDEQMQTESIEEIQKEINRIPPKKMSNSDESSKVNDSMTHNGKDDAAALTNNGNNNDPEESIEQILSSGLEPPKVGNILKSVLEKQRKIPSIEDSAEVAKDPILIEKAQEEIKKLDVLVCGECHNAFYYIQEFVEHKKGKCPQVSCLTGTCESESKPQVWGFILWKVRQIKDLRDNAPSSWSIYQTWCKLPQADKNAWITAGQSIQFASKIGNAKVTEVRPAKPVRQTTVQKIPNASSSPPPLEFVDSNKENSSNMDFENSPSNIIRKGFAKPVKLNNDVTIVPSSKNLMNNDLSTPNTAVRTTKVVSTQKDEFVVEKIMAKRFNPRKKTWEYNIKWENFGHDSNTWEPISNLSHCKKLLEQFEEQLKRMKEEKAKQAAQSQKARGRPSNPKPIKPSTTNFVPIAPKSIATISNVVGGVSDDYAGGSGNRPQRSSKQKAMSQVKQWCGNISDDDGSGAVGLKRKHESDDSDEDFDDKKIKLEEDSDYSDKEVVKPKIFKKVPTTFRPNPVKATTITPVKNGNTGPSQVLPSNILIPDANGVVRINQKQLPALSSGVYIMSKTAGIIKLDSTTSKVATSGGQTIVKVAPKIGQTQIKIVKKDGNTTKQIIQVSPKTTTPTTTPLKIAPNLNKATPKITPKIRKEVKKPPPLTEPAAKIVPKKSEGTPPKKPAPESDSDDGLEPLPFPDPDEPIPDLEEDKDEEFVLDPVTGKLAGVEYVDKPVVIKEEPQPRPPSTNELENIVKMAAADLSDEDLHNSDSQDDSRLFSASKDVTHTTKADQKSVDSGTPGVRKVVKYTVGGQNVRSENPILNRTLTQGQQKPVSAVVKSVTPQQQQRRVVQQKVINQMVTQRTPGQTRTVVRHVIEPSRPGQGGNINVIRKTVTSTPRPKFNLSPQKPLPSPLQPTRTYSAMGGIRQTNATAGPGSKVQVYSAKTSVSASQTAGGQMHQGSIRRIGNTVVRSTSGAQITATKQQYATQKQPVTRIVQRVVTSPKKPAGHQVLNNTQPKPATPIKPRTVINMPSLTEDDTPLTPPKAAQQKPPVASATTVQQAQQKVGPAAPKTSTNVVKQEPVLKDDEAVAEESSSLQAEALEAGAVADQTDWSSFTMADGENPIYVTGDDGTIYQVAGQNEQGQTILITQGADGQQQCLLVTNEISEMAPDEPQPSTSTAGMSVDAESTENDSTAAPPVTTEAQEAAVPTSVASSVEESLQTPLQIKTDSPEMEGIEDGVQDQVVAQVVRAEPPSPGGTHKVVVMLPDGNLMVTQVSPEEYASLELE